MTKKLMLLFGFKLALIYSIILSIFMITSEVSIFIFEKVLRITWLGDFSLLKRTITPQLIVVLVGLIIYLYIRNIYEKETVKLGIDVSDLLNNYKQFFILFLGTLLIINALTSLISLIDIIIYVLPNIKSNSKSISEIHQAIFNQEIIKSIFNVIKLIVGASLLFIFKTSKRTNTLEL